MSDPTPSSVATLFESELNRFSVTYREALSYNIDRLCVALANLGDRELIAIGSGGSYTAALFLAELHERVTGRLAHAITPLEFISKSGIADRKAVFLISAEGTNPDILESLYACRLANGAAINAITNIGSSELAERVAAAGGSVFAFPLSGGKDGYLATNTLVADIVLIARAYATIDLSLMPKFPSTIGAYSVGNSSFDDWIHQGAPRMASLLRYSTISVVYDPELKVAAVDLESKLIEAGITNVHIADLRNFAHGRHFWLARKGESTAVIALIGDHCIDLWHSIFDVLPNTLAIETLRFPGSFPLNTIAGIAAEMHLIKVAGQQHGIDPGKPDVPPFGRAIYHAPIHELVAPIYLAHRPPDAVRLKQSVLGYSSAAAPKTALTDALARFQERLSRQRYRALVFDYDGTLCDTNKRFDPPAPELVSELSKLAQAGTRVAIASGRGRSLYEHMRDCFAKDLWGCFVLGLYNGGHIIELRNDYAEPAESRDPSLDTVRRVIENLIQFGVPIARVSAKPHQVSVTPGPGVDAERLWFIISDAIRRAKITGPRIVRSAHSVDILGNSVSKLAVIQYLTTSSGISADTILSIGDQGAWPGNDYELLEGPNSLSVDFPSRNPDGGWKLAPSNLHGVNAVLWYLRRLRAAEGIFTIDLRGVT